MVNLDVMLYKNNLKPIKIKYLEKFGITANKGIHPGWEGDRRMEKLADKNDDMAKAYLALRQTHPIGWIGKWHYLFSSSKGNISLILLLDYRRIGQHIWEILCTDDKSQAKEKITDTRQFYKRADAIKYIIEILREDKNG